MVTLHRLILAVAMGATCLISAQLKSAKALPDYSPAFYSSMGQRLVVFPLAASAFDVLLPFPLGYFAYSPDGRALYAASYAQGDASNPIALAIYRIELVPSRADIVPGSAGLSPVSGLAVSLRKIVVSGRYQHGGVMRCGVFELALEGGEVRKVTDAPNCDYLSAWHNLSLSPDGERAVAVRKGQLELIDLTSGSTKALGVGYLKASWSPDGRWIAALQDGAQDKTVLLDAVTFARQKLLPNSEVVWSPDSRWLLTVVRSVRCGSDFGGLGRMDVLSGKLEVIPGSACKVNQPTTGWVSIARP